jgi:hypothetical protein
MHRMFKTLPLVGATCALALALACNRAPAAPTPTDATTPGSGDAAADGSTLKVTAPTLMSPTNGVTLDSRKPTMVVGNSTGRFVNRQFTYEFQLQNDSGGVIDSATMAQGGSGTTTWAYPTDLERDTPYRWRARARMGNAFGPWSSTANFRTVFEKRTPDPPPGQRLPYPNYGGGIVARVAAQRPDLLRRSCQDAGGTWEFLDLVVDTLRLEDTRFGYNCKRGNCGDPSKDIVAYHYGPGPDEGNQDVYIIDTIGGHCGDNPTPIWNDVTGITISSGTIGRWTSRGRF